MLPLHISILILQDYSFLPDSLYKSVNQLLHLNYTAYIPPDHLRGQNRMKFVHISTQLLQGNHALPNFLYKNGHLCLDYTNDRLVFYSLLAQTNPPLHIAIQLLQEQFVRLNL